MVYELRCTPEAKSYVGVAKQPLARRVAQHAANARAAKPTNARLAAAMHAHPLPACWTVTCLATFPSGAAAAASEEAAIAQRESRKPSKGYNVLTGAPARSALFHVWARKGKFAKRRVPN